MCQIVEGHNITVPLKKWGGTERLYLLISPKSGGAQAPLAPPVLPPLVTDVLYSRIV